VLYFNICKTIGQDAGLVQREKGKDTNLDWIFEQNFDLLSNAT